MSVETIQPQEFLKRLEDLPELKPFPAAAAKLCSACKDPDASPKQIVEIITCDPGLAAKLLQVSNSSMYGFSGRIRTIDHAVVLLGSKKVRDLALSMAGAEVFSQGDEAKDERNTLWKHSLAVATISRLIAPHVNNVVPEEAFLAGIFHDVGKLVFYDLIPAEYSEMHGRIDPSHRVEAENESFGIDHAELGLECADDWGLPQEIGNAIGSHHNRADTDTNITRVVQLANPLAHLWDLQQPECEEVSEEESNEVSEQLAALIEAADLSMDVGTLTGIRITASSVFAEISTVF